MDEGEGRGREVHEDSWMGATASKGAPSPPNLLASKPLPPSVPSPSCPPLPPLHRGTWILDSGLPPSPVSATTPCLRPRTSGCTSGAQGPVPHCVH